MCFIATLSRLSCQVVTFSWQKIKLSSQYITKTTPSKQDYQFFWIEMSISSHKRPTYASLVLLNMLHNDDWLFNDAALYALLETRLANQWKHNGGSFWQTSSPPKKTTTTKHIQHTSRFTSTVCLWNVTIWARSAKRTNNPLCNELSLASVLWKSKLLSGSSSRSE